MAFPMALFLRLVYAAVLCRCRQTWSFESIGPTICLILPYSQPYSQPSHLAWSPAFDGKSHLDQSMNSLSVH